MNWHPLRLRLHLTIAAFTNIINFETDTRNEKLFIKNENTLVVSFSNCTMGIPKSH